MALPHFFIEAEYLVLAVDFVLAVVATIGATLVVIVDSVVEAMLAVIVDSVLCFVLAVLSRVATIVSAACMLVVCSAMLALLSDLHEEVGP